MTEIARPEQLERDFTERRDWGVRFLLVAGVAVWLLSGVFGSSGYGGEDSWSVTIGVIPEVRGAVIGMVALAWLVTEWQRHDRAFVTRVRGLVLSVAWSLVAVAAVGSYAALFLIERAPSEPPTVFFPLELAYTSL